MPNKIKLQTIRKNINPNRLVGILNNHILDCEKYPLKQSQVMAASLLLKKAVPDLRSVELRGKVDNKVEVTIRVEDA